MCEIIHRVDFPCGAGAMMGSLDDAVHNGITEMHIGRRHVDLCTEHSRTLIKFAIVHADEKIEIFFRCAVTIWTFLSGDSGSAFLLRYLLGCLVVDISFSFFYQSYSEIKKLWKIIGSIILSVTPVKSQPMYVFSD